MNNSDLRAFLSGRFRLAAGLVALSVAGCRTAGEIPDAVVPPITSRFAQSGPTEVSGQQLIKVNQSVNTLKVEVAIKQHLLLPLPDLLF